MLVIPAKAGIQENTGFRVKPGMTITKRLISMLMLVWTNRGKKNLPLPLGRRSK
jgi:hypothetical protein